jgi:hypothetical protein
MLVVDRGLCGIGASTATCLRCRALQASRYSISRFAGRIVKSRPPVPSCVVRSSVDHPLPGVGAPATSSVTSPVSVRRRTVGSVAWIVTVAGRVGVVFLGVLACGLDGREINRQARTRSCRGRRRAVTAPVSPRPTLPCVDRDAVASGQPLQRAQALSVARPGSDTPPPHASASFPPSRSLGERDARLPATSFVARTCRRGHVRRDRDRGRARPEIVATPPCVWPTPTCRTASPVDRSRRHRPRLPSR